ncbi:MAG TPA: ABC transporter substrate-binding protein, partial [Chloroflexota bacterium]|nr:ABC transporter substrate-binding protein [Chloroflexota bacterium]
IDRDAMIKAMTAGLGKPAYQPFFPNSPAYNPDLENRWKFDPAKVKQLLSDAGFANGLSFKSIIGANTGVYVNFGNLMQAQLKAQNITMDLSFVNQADTVPMFWRNGPTGHGTAPSSPLGGLGTGPVGTDLAFRNGFLKDGATNAGNAEVPGLRDLVDKAAAATDRAQAADLYKQASKLISDGLYQIVPMYYPVGVAAAWNYVGGIRQGLLETMPDFFRGVFITQGKTPA